MQRNCTYKLALTDNLQEQINNELFKLPHLVADVLEHAGVLLPFCVGVRGSSLHGRGPQARLV